MDLALDEEYEIQLYDFTLRELKFSTRLCFLKHLRCLVSKIDDALYNKNLLDRQTPNERSEEMKLVYRNIKKKIYDAFMVFDIKVDKYFKIPRYVVLPENMGQNCLNEPDNCDEKEIKELEFKLLQMKICKSKLQHELDTIKRYDTAICDERKFLQNLDTTIQKLKSLNEFKLDENLLMKIKKI